MLGYLPSMHHLPIGLCCFLPYLIRRFHDSHILCLFLWGFQERGYIINCTAFKAMVENMFSIWLSLIVSDHYGNWPKGFQIRPQAEMIDHKVQDPLFLPTFLGLVWTSRL